MDWGDARRFSVLVPFSSGSSVFGHVSFFVRRLGNGIGETQPSWPAGLCVLQVTDIYIENIQNYRSSFADSTSRNGLRRCFQNTDCDFT